MSQVKQIKDSTNIVEIIGERIQLKKAGSSFKANCPFHSETTPSFFINEQIQRYKCFGCGETGDALEFLQKYEGMTFVESMQYLAERAGIELKDFQRTSADDERDRLLEIMSLAKEYYSYLLTKHKTGQVARDYLKERGINQESIKLFQMGYALPSWDGLIKYLHKKKKYHIEDLLKAGLVIKTKTGRYYDRFRDRVVFPLKNHRGQVVGFSGRTMAKDVKEAKYINSPETSLYHKSKMLYGYSELFREIKKKEEIILVEGEFDVISSAQNHVNNIVAIKGSALTIDQVKLLERVAKRVLLSLDADKAGVAATKRAIEVIKDSQLELRVIDFSSLDQDQRSKDPDELARQNPKQWREVSGKSISVYQFLLDVSLENNDPKKPEGKKEILTEMAPILSSIDLEVEKDFYVNKLAEAINVKPNVIKDDVRRVMNRKKDYSSASRNEKKISKPKKKTLRHRFEAYLLFLLFRADSEVVKDLSLELLEFDFLIPEAKDVLEQLSKFKPKFDLKSFSGFLSEDLKQALFDWYQNPEYVKLLDTYDWQEEWDQTLKSFKKEMMKAQITDINKEIEKLDQKNNRTDDEEVELNKLLEKIVQLQRNK